MVFMTSYDFSFHSLHGKKSGQNHCVSLPLKSVIYKGLAAHKREVYKPIISSENERMAIDKRVNCQNMKNRRYPSRHGYINVIINNR